MKIYKYYNPSSYSLTSLEKGYFWLNFPENFNDPFDTYLNVEVSGKLNEWKTFLEKSLHFSENEALSFINLNRIVENQQYTFSNIENNFRKSQVVSCFSTKNDSILMWSHYTEKHSGFCLGFSVIKPNNFYLLDITDDDYNNFIYFNGRKYLPLRKVEYLIKKPKPFNPLKDSEEIFIQNTLQKSKVWKYENEYRLVISPKNYKNNTVNFCKNILTDIYFGINTTEKTINEIQDIIRYVYKPIKTIKFHYPKKDYLEYLIKYEKYI